jgi:hypothetical protein
MDLMPALEADRVRAHTAPAVLGRIDRSTRGAVAEAAQAEAPDAIHRRLAELAREWDVDRALMAFFSVAATAVLQLGLRKRRGLQALVQAQIAFLGLHAVVGWCPPLALFRRLGFRTTREIDAERDALRRLLETRAAPAH